MAYKKPTVYNPRIAEDRIAELEAKVKHQAKRVNELLEENTNLKIQVDHTKSLESIIDTQHNTIQTYHKIFAIQEAEIKKLKEGKHNATN